MASPETQTAQFGGPESWREIGETAISPSAEKLARQERQAARRSKLRNLGLAVMSMVPDQFIDAYDAGRELRRKMTLQQRPRTANPTPSHEVFGTARSTGINDKLPEDESTAWMRD